MNKYVKTIGLTAALAVMVPLSAFAATSTSATTDSAAQGQVQQHAGKSMKAFGGKHDGRGGMYISDSVLTLLNLDRDALNEKLAAGSTLAEIATAQGVTEEALKSALSAAFTEQQAKQKEQFSANLDTLISSKQPQEQIGKGFGPGGRQLDTVAAALGLTVDELRTELEGGKTIAALAEAKGLSTDSLISKLETAINTQIDQAVTDGKLTSEQAATQKEKTAEQAKNIVNGEFTPKGGEGFGPRGGKGGVKPGSSSTEAATSTSGTNA